MTDDVPPLLELLGILRDNIDQVCTMMEQLQQMIEVETDAIAPYLEDLDPKTLDLAFAKLPPKSAVALATAFMLLADLVPASKAEAEKQAAVFKKSVDTFYAVRKHLHTALDGVV